MDSSRHRPGLGAPLSHCCFETTFIVPSRLELNQFHFKLWVYFENIYSGTLDYDEQIWFFPALIWTDVTCSPPLLMLLTPLPPHGERRSDNQTCQRWTFQTHVCRPSGETQEQTIYFLHCLFPADGLSGLYSLRIHLAAARSTHIYI